MTSCEAHTRRSPIRIGVYLNPKKRKKFDLFFSFPLRKDVQFIHILNIQNLAQLVYSESQPFLMFSRALMT